MSYSFNSTWEALQADGWNDAQLAEIAMWWNENDFISPTVKSFEMERAMTLEYYVKIRSNHSLALSELESMEKNHSLLGELATPTSGIVLRHFHFPVWRVAWSSQDELHGLLRWDPELKLAKVDEQRGWVDAKVFARNSDLSNEIIPNFLTTDTGTNSSMRDLFNRCRYLFSSTSFFNGSKTVLRSAETETQKNLIVSAIALRRYHLKNGKWPSTLNELVPAFLPKVPDDPMDGKPIRYHLNPDQTYKLYSVGLDGIDDQGNSDPADASDGKSVSLWRRKDVVLPVADPAQLSESTKN
jgi:hypothetical protein